MFPMINVFHLNGHFHCCQRIISIIVPLKHIWFHFNCEFYVNIYSTFLFIKNVLFFFFFRSFHPIYFRCSLCLSKRVRNTLHTLLESSSWNRLLLWHSSGVLGTYPKKTYVCFYMIAFNEWYCCVFVQNFMYFYLIFCCVFRNRQINNFFGCLSCTFFKKFTHNFLFRSTCFFECKYLLVLS